MVRSILAEKWDDELRKLKRHDLSSDDFHLSLLAQPERELTKTTWKQLLKDYNSDYPLDILLTFSHESPSHSPDPPSDRHSSSSHHSRHLHRSSDPQLGAYYDRRRSSSSGRSTSRQRACFDMQAIHPTQTLSPSIGHRALSPIPDGRQSRSLSRHRGYYSATTTPVVSPMHSPMISPNGEMYPPADFLDESTLPAPYYPSRHPYSQQAHNIPPHQLSSAGDPNYVTRRDVLGYEVPDQSYNPQPVQQKNGNLAKYYDHIMM